MDIAIKLGREYPPHPKADSLLYKGIGLDKAIKNRSLRPVFYLPQFKIIYLVMHKQQ